MEIYCYRKKEIKFITDDIEITFDDSNEEDSDEENFFINNSDENKLWLRKLNMYIYVGELKKTFCRNVFINKYVFNDDYPISLSLSIYI